MITWCIDRVLPGLAVVAVSGAWTWLSHSRLRRDIIRLTNRQTLRLEQVAAEHAAATLAAKGRR